jgi:hypothetical protein
MRRLSFVLAVCLFGCQQPSEQKQPPPKAEQKAEAKLPKAIEAIRVASADLFQDYLISAEQANQKYRGKLLEVSGPMQSVSRDKLGMPSVCLIHASVGSQVMDLAVRCVFPKERAGTLSRLYFGEMVTIRGTCRGRDGDVLLTDCELMPKATAP